MSSIRKMAAEIAYSAIFGDADVETTVDGVLRNLRPEIREADFFRNLATETVRRAGTLDAVLAAYCETPLSQLNPRVLSALRAAAYEIIFMEQGAACAAIESSRQIVEYWNPRELGTVEKTLRAIAAGAGPVLRDKPSARDVRRMIPVGASLWRRLDRDVLPDPGRGGAEFLAVLHSFPVWLVRRLLGQHGKSTEGLLVACNSPEPTAILANCLKTSREELASRLQRRGVNVQRSPSGQALVVTQASDLARLPSDSDGSFSISEQSEIALVEYMNPLADERICVLQGSLGMMSHAAQLTSPGGRVTGCLRSPVEASRVLSERRRLGLHNLEFVVAETGDIPSVLNTSFDRVLVKPPSTGIGGFRRSVAARWRLKEESIPALVAAEKQALEVAIELCAAGGIVVYATSTVLREENEDQVHAVTGGMPYVKLVDSRSGIPVAGGPCGGFRARIAKLGLF
jgi:16S rRNA (cytosine967-C5)-methyltransferase